MIYHFQQDSKNNCSVTSIINNDLPFSSTLLLDTLSTQYTTCPPPPPPIRSPSPSHTPIHTHTHTHIHTATSDQKLVFPTLPSHLHRVQMMNIWGKEAWLKIFILTWTLNLRKSTCPLCGVKQIRCCERNVPEMSLHAFLTVLTEGLTFLTVLGLLTQVTLLQTAHFKFFYSCSNLKQELVHSVDHKVNKHIYQNLHFA